jgi:hypothetical protein
LSSQVNGMQSDSSDHPKPGIHPLLVSFALAASFVVLLCTFFYPRWESNDDVAMSMIAHGYGLAAYGSPDLVFSNVLWGYVVRAIPTIHGVLGYSVATLGVTVLVGTAVVYFLARMGVGYLTSLLVLTLVLSRPVLFPQFTINAGLLTCAAVLGSLAYARSEDTFCLAASCLLAFLGYLLRDQEFALIIFVALPLLPWRLIREQRKLHVALSLLAVAIVTAMWFNHWSTSGADWRYYQELNSVRAPFTDFDAKARLLAKREVMARYGLSSNDVELISAWFFVDQQLVNPARLRAILSELGPAALVDTFPSMRAAIAALATLQLLPLFVSAAALLALTFSRRLLLSWLLCLGSVAAMGFVGRPGILRVYFPLSVLLFLLPIAIRPILPVLKRTAVALLLALASLANASILIREARVSDQMIANGRESHFAANKSIVIWGASVPLEHMLAVTVSNPDLEKTSMVALGVFTFAPFAVAKAEEQSGNGLVAHLRSAEGILISANDSLLKLLAVYCAEHYGERLDTATVYESKLWTVRHVRCITPLNPLTDAPLGKVPGQPSRMEP